MAILDIEGTCGRVKNVKGLLIAFLYGITSASMAFVNKAVLTSYGYNYPLFIVSCQMIFSIILLEGLNLCGRIQLTPFSLSRGYSFILPSTCYAINSVLALSALGGMNIPMYGVIKRCTPVVVLLLGAVLLGKGAPSKQIILSITMITIGCFIAGYGDLTFDMKAYAYGLSSVVSQSLYLILVQKSSKDLSATETLHLNSFNTLPLLVIFCVLFGECREAVPKFAGFLHDKDVGFILVFGTVICVGCALNYLLFLCTQFNSALTTSVTGTLKSIIQTAIGIFTFGGIILNIWTVVGITLNLSGGIFYSLAKYRESRSNRKESVSRLVGLPSTVCMVDMNGGSKLQNGILNMYKKNGISNGHVIGAGHSIKEEHS